MSFGIPYEILKRVPIAERQAIFEMFDLNNHDGQLQARLTEAIKYIEENYPQTQDIPEVIESEPRNLLDKIPEPKYVSNYIKTNPFVPTDKEDGRRISIFRKTNSIKQDNVPKITDNNQKFAVVRPQREEKKEVYLGETSFVVKCSVYDFFILNDCDLLILVFSNPSSTKNIHFRQKSVLGMMILDEQNNEQLYKIEYMNNFKMDDLEFFIFKIIRD